MKRDHSKKRVQISLYIIGILTFSSIILAGSQLSAQQDKKNVVRSSRSAALKLQDIDPLMLKKKLDEIYNNQEKILDKFQAVLDEIQVVKIRATLR